MVSSTLDWEIMNSTTGTTNMSSDVAATTPVRATPEPVSAGKIRSAPR